MNKKVLYIILSVVVCVIVVIVVLLLTRKKSHKPSNIQPRASLLGLPHAKSVYTSPTYYDLATRVFTRDIKPPVSIKDCFVNYFIMLFPVTDPSYWRELSEGQLRLVYNMLDWYYTPLIVEPKLPFPLNSTEELQKLSDIPNDRVRPLVGPYHDAYIPFFPMAALEPLVKTGTMPSIVGAKGNYPLPASGGLGWPDCPDCTIARPLMNVSYIAPYGRARVGFPSFAYVEVTSYALEGAGAAQRAAPTCTIPYGNPQLSSFDGVQFADGSQEAKDAVKYGVAKVDNPKVIYGPGYMGTSDKPGAWGTKENFTTDDTWSDCYKNTGVLGPTASNKACVCVPNKSGFRSLPHMALPDNSCIDNSEQLVYINKSTGKPFNLLSMYSGSSGRGDVVIKDASSGQIYKPQDLAYCPFGTAPNCNALPYGLFYPQKGYGKFLNLGKVGTFFSYVHMLWTIHDSNGYGRNFRYPFEAVCLATPGEVSGHNIIGQVQQLCGMNNMTDKREYLMGWVTIPKKGLFKSGLLDNYYDTIGRAGRIDYATEGGKFTPGKPQVIFDADVAKKVWGKPYGCGQSRWQMGETDKVTGQEQKCENPWMNPMDDGGRLEYIGKNFIQFYFPPQMKIKNPNYGKKLSDIFPQTFTADEVTAITGSKTGTGSTGNVNKDTMQELAIRWVMGMYIYGDTGIQIAGTSFPFGAYSSTGTADLCLYSLCASMGWKTVVISSKPNTGGQPISCEYPYYDNEILSFTSYDCQDNAPMSWGGCGPFGQLTFPPEAPKRKCGTERKQPYFSQWGGYQVCHNMVTLDVTQNIDRYLLDGFLPAFQDFSTSSDTDYNNENSIFYGATKLDRKHFALNEASSDVPAQYSRNMYNPPSPVKQCSICPGSVPPVNMPPTGDNWKEFTEKYKGNPALNSALGEQSHVLVNNIYTKWQQGAVHSKLGCLNIN